MYSVSNNYLNALAAPVKTFRLIGTVGTVSFDESNIIDISIDNQVSEGSEIKIGSVYAGVLTATFNGLTIARGSWVGKTITLSEGLLIDATNDTYEDVPLGIFTVAEANHTAEGVEVTAYDAMTNFDKTRNDLTDTGTAYAFLTLMCQKCGVTLGSTLADIQALPNGTETFSIYAENDIETWRDLLSWIAQTLGAVATIGRDGKLYLRQYSMTAAATIDETHRFTGCSFSDFVTYYTGMSVVDIALRQTEYKSEVVDDGLTYNLGSNPLVQGHYEYVQEIIDDFSNVALTPFNAQMLGGAIYDLCDCLTFSGGIAAGATCGVMGYTWKYNGAYSVKGFGANPALASAKSKTQKELEALYNTVGQEINEMSVVQNSTAVTIAENTETSILKYNFEVTEEENTTMVDVSVVMTATATETLAGEVYTLADLVAQLRFYVDNSQVTVYDPTFIVDEGKDTMTFNYSLSGLSVGAHEFDIRLEMSGGSGSVAVGDVHEMLWGYGITFEVYAKAIQVDEMPYRTTFYVGQSLNYNGLKVNKIFNNGLTEDVTSACTFDPAQGTALTEYDIGSLTVDVSEGDFYTDFALTVREMAYEILEGDYINKQEKNVVTQICVIGTTVYAFGVFRRMNNNPTIVTVAKMQMGSNNKLEYISRGNYTESATSSGISLWYSSGCRIGEYWYSFFSSKYANTPVEMYRESATSSYTMNVSFVYAPDNSKTVEPYNYAIKKMYSLDGRIYVPSFIARIDGTAMDLSAWGVINGTNITFYVTNAGTIDTDFAYRAFRQSDGFSDDVGTANDNNIYETRFACSTVSNGELSIYEYHCADNGVTRELVETIETNLQYVSEGSVRQILDSTVLLFTDTVQNPFVVASYNVVTHEYNEFTCTASDPSYKTVQNRGNILWNNHFGCYFLPQNVLDYYYLYRSFDLETWELVEQLECESESLGIGVIANFGNDVIGTWRKQVTESGTTYNVQYGITLDFTDTE